MTTNNTKLDVDGWCAWHPEEGAMRRSFAYDEAETKEILDIELTRPAWPIKDNWQVLPVKLIHAERWRELMEWVEKSRISFSEIQFVLRLLKHETTASAIQIIMDDLNCIMQENHENQKTKD